MEEEDDEELCKWEHCANELTEIDVPVVTQSVSDDLDISEAIPDFQDNAGPILDQVEVDMHEETDEEIADTKKKNCAYQVRFQVCFKRFKCVCRSCGTKKPSTNRFKGWC